MQQGRRPVRGPPPGRRRRPGPLPWRGLEGGARLLGHAVVPPATLPGRSGGTCRACHTCRATAASRASKVDSLRPRRERAPARSAKEDTDIPGRIEIEDERLEQRTVEFGTEAVLGEDDAVQGRIPDLDIRTRDRVCVPRDVDLAKVQRELVPCHPRLGADRGPGGVVDRGVVGSQGLQFCLQRAALQRQVRAEDQGLAGVREVDLAVPHEGPREIDLGLRGRGQAGRPHRPSRTAHPRHPRHSAHPGPRRPRASCDTAPGTGLPARPRGAGSPPGAPARGAGRARNTPGAAAPGATARVIGFSTTMLGPERDESKQESFRKFFFHREIVFPCGTARQRWRA